MLQSARHPDLQVRINTALDQPGWLARILHNRRSMATASAPRRALYSLHDVTPAKETLVFAALDHLRALGLTQVAMLIVPDFHGRADLREFPAFCAEFKKRLLPGDEILLHGYYHLADTPPQTPGRKLASAMLTAGEGEFHDLSYDEASRRIRAGLQVLHEALDLKPTGFVAPAWLQNANVRRAVADAGLGFCEDQLRIWPSHGAPIFSPALSFASRMPVRLWGSVVAGEISSRVLPRQPVSRVGIHPNDYRSPHLRRAITRVVTRWQATAASSRYQEVLP